MNLREFFNECREKDVFKNLSIYIVSSWVFLQVFALVMEPLGFPKISLTYLLLILIVGFPIYIYLIWRYRIKAEHIEESDAATEAMDLGTASSKSNLEIDPGMELDELSLGIDKKFRRMYFLALVFIGLLSVLSAFFIVRTNLIKENSPVMGGFLSAEGSDKIAILKFDNNTGNEEYDMVGKIAVDWIMHGITQNKAGQVISPKLVEDYANILKASIMPSGENGILTEYLKPSRVIIGEYYLNRGKLLIQSSVTDANMAETLMSFAPVECDPESPLDCIEALKQRVVGFLITDKDKKNNLQERPPTYEAYRSFLLAEEKGKEGNNEEYIRLLNKAISEDSTYFEPKVLRVAFYYNQGAYVKSDSLLKVLSKETSNNRRQVNLLNFYEALLAGNNRNSFQYLKNEYDEETDHPATNLSLMVLGHQFVNRPEVVDSIYKHIPMGDIDLDKCQQCVNRLYIKGLADLNLGKAGEVVELIGPFAKTKGQHWLKQTLIRALVREGNQEGVEDVLDSYKLLADSYKRWGDLNIWAAKEYLLLGDITKAKQLFEQLIQSLDRDQLSEEDYTELLAWAYFYQENYQEAEKHLEQLVNKNRIVRTTIPFWL